MTTVNGFERAIVRDRHHRRPRSSSSFSEDIEAAVSQPLGLGMSAPEPSFSFHTSLPQEVAFPNPTSTVDWIFWSVDGQAGRVQTVDPEHFWITASGETMTATAWYGPPAGVATQPPAPTDIMVDAFSAVTGAPIDEDFVTVVSDPTLTAQANDDGWVPTATSVTLEAAASIGDLSFDQWIVVGAGSTAPDHADQLLVPEAAESMALAVYVASGPINDVPSGPAIWNRWVRDLAAVGGLLLRRTEQAAVKSPLGELELRLSANQAIRALAGDLDVTPEVAKLLDEDSWSAIRAAVAPAPDLQK